MAIHNKDSGTKDRSIPVINTVNKQPIDTRMNLGTHSQQFNGGVTTNPAYIYSKDAKTLVNDGYNDRIILGLLPDGTYGIAVSVPGIDVEDAFI